MPDRIGFGLAKAGPTLFITSVSDILALCFIAWTVKLGPVRDLCLYASVLIFVDWWMLHTFFLTVISIDCQRLELADLLRQGVEQPRKAQLQIQVNHTNGKHGTEGDRQSPDTVAIGSGGARKIRGGGACADVKTLKSGWIKGAKSIWKARTARGGSMVLVSGARVALHSILIECLFVLVLAAVVGNGRILYKRIASKGPSRPYSGLRISKIRQEYRSDRVIPRICTHPICYGL